MKRLLVVCFMVCSVLPALAQLEHYPGLINRLGGQEVDAAALSASSIVSQSKTDEGQQKPTGASSALSLVLLNSNRVELSEGDVIIIDANIFNNTSSDISLNFIRTHVRLPLQWTSSICFGVTCYSPGTDSLKPANAFNVPTGTQPADFHLNFYCPKGSSPDSIVDYIKFFIQGGAPSDTVSATFVGVLPESDAVEQQKEAILGQPKIVSIYPSPLVDGSSIRVKISSPRELSFSYSIVDEVGRQVAIGTTHQHLIQGDNTCQIGELNGLANGSYQVKFTFGDGSIDTRSFQIAH